MILHKKKYISLTVNHLNTNSKVFQPRNTLKVGISKHYTEDPINFPAMEPFAT